MTICTIDKDINKCIWYDPETGACTSEKPCGMAKAEFSSVNKPEYVRQERWYEKYYKNR